MGEDYLSVTKEKDNFSNACLFARYKHRDQKDDDGNDYFLCHLSPVCEGVQAFTNDHDVWSAAILHDVLEDTDATYEKLVEEFGQRIADLVNEVTDEGEADSYGKYFPRLKSKEAIMIKLIDRASNISRMSSWNEKRQAHYLKKTKFWKDGSQSMPEFESTNSKPITKPTKVLEGCGKPLSCHPQASCRYINLGGEQLYCKECPQSHDKESKK